MSKHGKSQYEPPKKSPKNREKVETTPFNKKTFSGVVVLILLSVATSIYSLIRTVRDTGSDKNKIRRPQIAGLDIPREVLERMQRLKNAQDRENVLKEWAASEGITFQSKKDGSYVSIRDGEEYVIRGPDPDYVPSDAEEEESQEEAADALKADDDYFESKQREEQVVSQ